MQNSLDHTHLDTLVTLRVDIQALRQDLAYETKVLRNKLSEIDFKLLTTYDASSKAQLSAQAQTILNTFEAKWHEILDKVKKQI